MKTAAAVAADQGVFRPSGKIGGADVYRIRCLAHGGTKRNLALWDGDGGSIGAKCHSHECSYEDIAKAHGFELTYSGIRYDRADGGHVERRRGAGKDYSGNRGSSKDTHLRIWSVDDPTATMVIVEGEKAAHALDCLDIDGVIAASWVGGSGNVKHVNFARVRGRAVVVWGDADTPGRAAARTAAASCLRAGARSVKMVDTTGLPDGADAADVTGAQARELLSNARAYKPKPSDISAPPQPSIDTLNIAHVYQIREEGDMPTPSLHRIVVDGVRMDIGDLSNLTSQAKFRNFYADLTGRWLTALPRGQWDIVVQALLDRRELIHPGHPAHPKSTEEKEETREWVQVYLDVQAENIDRGERGEIVEEIIADKAARQESYIHEDVAHLFLPDFLRWVNQRQDAGLTTRSLSARLRDIGWTPRAVKYRFMGKRTTRSVWLDSVDSVG